MNRLVVLLFLATACLCSGCKKCGQCVCTVGNVTTEVTNVICNSDDKEGYNSLKEYCTPANVAPGTQAECGWAEVDH